LETENSKDIALAEAELLGDCSIVRVHGTSCEELDNDSL
jgi:hypothetical protein